MTNRRSQLILTAAAFALTSVAASGLIQSNSPPDPPMASGVQETTCWVDLDKPGMMSDIVSNALILGLDRPEPKVRAFLEGSESSHATGQDLLKAAAAHFGLTEKALADSVTEYEHCNCSHGPDFVRGEKARRSGEVSPGWEVTPFARDVMLHVVLHEMGHALVREFDLPVLGNEETLADAFATYYLTTHLPDRALASLHARVTSLMIEAGEVPRAEWEVSGEHNSDARRAYQITALAMAADARTYRPIAESIGMSEDDIRSARDYGTEIHRSWRRILAPLWMPEGALSGEARVSYDENSAQLRQLCAGGFADELRTALQRIDWHSQVKILFEEGDGGAGWSRSKRTITVHSAYLQRFVRQGKAAQED